MSDVISGYWKNFAYSGNPNGANLPQWHPVVAHQYVTQEIGEHTGEIPLAPPEKLHFWLQYFASPISRNAPLF